MKNQMCWKWMLVLQIIIGSACSVLAQVEVGRFQNIVESLGTGSAAYGAGFTGQYNATGNVNGSPYEAEEYRKMSFSFYRPTTYLVADGRYNILQNEFEVQTTGGLKPLPGNVVKGFKVVAGKGDTVRYLNAKDFEYDGTRLIGFLEEVSAGQVKLFRMVQIDIQKPTYNPSLEVGDRNVNLKQREVHFYLSENELIQIKGKKEVVEALKERSVDVADFMKREKINPKKSADLKFVFDFYNNNSPN